ncbi:SpvB/TcaC N-terminal domain-containing protein [Synoicihabitans lomoniglobus]|uniref:SpvB/TcaC N-terminal domain-containing protein n=1 Tax=Synoicihabitans lomoniglobus TaxID=2909285 RepID=A0AAF0CR71_9BACT|nr:SpvB/TcaC N-terminal domain-containing protein [Opitutaceae bacterium LMO-M01]
MRILVQIFLATLSTALASAAITAQWVPGGTANSAEEGTAYTVTAQVTSTSGGFATFEIRKAGVTMKSANTSGSPTSMTLSYTTTAVGTGESQYQIFAMTVASGGSPDVTESVFHTVDYFPGNDAPTVTGWGTTPTMIGRNQSFTVTVQASDADGNLTSIVVQDQYGTQYPQTWGGVGLATYTRTFQAPPNVGDVLTLTAWAVDSDGEPSATTTHSIVSTGTNLPVRGMRDQNGQEYSIGSVLPVLIGQTYSFTAWAHDSPDNDLAQMSVVYTAYRLDFSGVNHLVVEYSEFEPPVLSADGLGVEKTFVRYGGQPDKWSYRYWVIAADGSGWISGGTGVALDVDQHNVYPQTVDFNSQSVSRIEVGDTLTLSANLQDADGNMTQVLMSYQGPNDVVPISMGNPTSGSASIPSGTTAFVNTWAFTPTQVGVYTFQVYGQDPYPETGQSHDVRTITVEVVPVGFLDDDGPPPPPTGLQVGTLGSETMEVFWTKSTATDVNSQTVQWAPVGGSTSSANIGFDAESWWLNNLQPDTDYNITVTANDKHFHSTTSSTLTARTNLPPLTADIDVDVLNAYAPGAARVYWNSAYADTISVTGNLSGHSWNTFNGDHTISGLGVGTHTFTLTASGPTGTVTRTDSFVIHGTTTASLSASPNPVNAPGTVTLTWDTDYANSRSLSGPYLSSLPNPLPADGSHVVSGLPEGNHTYTLSATGGSGTATDAVTVVVNPPPNTQANVVWYLNNAALTNNQTVSIAANEVFEIYAIATDPDNPANLLRLDLSRNGEEFVSEEPTIPGGAQGHASIQSPVAYQVESVAQTVVFTAESVDAAGAVGTAILNIAITGGGAVGNGNDLFGTLTGDPTPATPSPATLGVGTLGGDLQVDNRGSANYSIPLRIPPGRGGMQPSLSLNYSSGAGNGLLGIGFSLSTGFPEAIMRGRDILARDGQVRAVHFDAADKFYLDGKRLILTSGESTRGKSGSTYRTEVDSFVVVTATSLSGSAGQSIDGFTLSDKNGLFYQFGKYTGSGIDGYQTSAESTNELAYRYALKQVSDPIGNTVTFSYQDVTNGAGQRLGEYVLKDIHYTSNPDESVTAKGAVTLYYNTSAEGTAGQRHDRSLQYVAGKKFSQTRRLDAIDISFNGARVAYYDLDYTYATNHGVTRLERVHSYFRNGNGSGFMRLPASEFDWWDSAPTHTYQGAPLIESAGHSAIDPVSGAAHGKAGTPFTFADVNGDGRTDLIDADSSTGILVSLGTDAGFGSASNWTPGITWHGVPALFQTGDIDGDGLADILYGNPAESTGGSHQLFVLRSDRTKFVSLPGATITITDEFTNATNVGQGTSSPFMIQNEEKGAVADRIMWADFTGDGRDDVLIHRYDGDLQLRASLGSSFGGPTKSDVGANALNGLAIWDTAHRTIGMFLGYERLSNFSVSMIPCELNGDGRMDYAWIETTSQWNSWGGSFSGTGSNVYGLKHLYAVTSQPDGTFSQRRIVNGRGWSASATNIYRSSSHLIMPGDVNGDGLTDFLVLTPAEVIENAYGIQSAYVLRHLLFLSEGSHGVPSFQQAYGGISPSYTLAGQTGVRPWFDKITPNNWSSGNYNNIKLLAGSQDPAKREILLSLGISSPSDNNLLYDVNHDGKQDYVWYNDQLSGANQGWWVMYSEGDRFSAPQLSSLNWNPSPKIGAEDTDPDVHTRRQLDFNGDGISDFTFAASSRKVVPGIDGLYLSSGQPGPRLQMVTNGLGRTTTINYEPITDDLIYTPGASVSYPIRELRNANYVVSQVEHDSGGPSSATFGYQYAGSRLDLAGRGSLGFQSFITIDHQTSLLRYQFLAQSFPMTGLTVREETYRPTGANAFNLLSSHDNTVVFDKVMADAAGSTGPHGTLYPFISQAIEYRWEDGDKAFTNTAGSELFGVDDRDDAYVVISAASVFDAQGGPQTALAGLPAGFNPSDTTNSGNENVNTVAGVGSGGFASIHDPLPGKIDEGNLELLSTNYGDDFTETVDYNYAEAPDGTVMVGRVSREARTAVSPGVTTPAAAVKTYGYFNNSSLIETETVDSANDKLDVSTNHVRDSLGRIQQTTVTGSSKSDRQGIGTYISYQATDFDDVFDQPTVTADAYGHTTTTVYHEWLGLPTSATDANGVQVTTAYDALGRPTETRRITSLTNRKTTIDYEPSTQSVSHTMSTGTEESYSHTAAYRTVATPDYRPSSIAYFDRLGRPIRAVRNGAAGAVYTDTVYNVLGQVAAVSNPDTSSAPDRWTETLYDELGRAKSIAAPNGATTHNVYDGLVTEMTVVSDADAGDQVTTTLANARGETVKIWNANNLAGTTDNPTLTASTGASLTFVLDGFGRMRETHLKGQTGDPILAEYDDLGNQTKLDDPDKGLWTYQSNARGQVVWQKDAKNTETTFVFDDLGRPLSRVTEQGAETESAEWIYYELAAAGAPNSVEPGDAGWIGALQSASVEHSGSSIPYANYSNARSYTYDDAGRVHMVVHHIDDMWFYTTSGYDDTRDLPDQMDYYWRHRGTEDVFDPAAPNIWRSFGFSTTHDNLGYVGQITTTDGNTWWSAISYDHLDRPKVFSNGGYTTTRTYDDVDELLTGISTPGVQALGFAYDDLGNLKTRTKDGSLSETFTYDVVNRMVDSTQTGVVGYDDHGRITSKLDVDGVASATYAYGDSNHPHAVTSAWNLTYAYDANGNLSSRSDGVTTKWVGFDKPLWIARNGIGRGFHYNSDRQRVVQHEFNAIPNGALTATSFSGKKIYVGGGLEADYALNSSQTALELDRIRIYVGTPSGTSGAVEIDGNLGTGSQHRRLVYHHDHLGSIETITNFNGGAVASDEAGRDTIYSYDAWGERRDPLNWSGAPTILTTQGGPDDLTPRGFTGHEMLDDLGLVHMNGRIYDPLLGRFLSADIVVQAPGNLQSYNRYSYVLNNPLTMTDPTGYFWDPDSGWWGSAEYGTFGKAAVVDPAVEGYKSGTLHMEKGFTEIANAESGLDVTIGVLEVIAGVGEGVGIVADFAPGGKQINATAGALAKHADEIGDAASRATKALSGKVDDAAGGASQAQRRLDDVAVDTKRVEVDSKSPPTTEVAAKGGQPRNADGTFASGSGGDSASAARGREAHKNYQNATGEGYQHEVTLDSGKRADAVNFETRTVRELKPDNPNAVKRGERQVEKYRKELEEMTGEEWKGVVDTY